MAHLRTAELAAQYGIPQSCPECKVRLRFCDLDDGVWTLEVQHDRNCRWLATAQAEGLA